MSTRVTKEEVVRALKAAMATIGFKKTGRSIIFLRSVSTELYAWVGMPMGRNRGADSFSVQPMVGVHYPELMSLMFELTGGDIPKSPIATVARNIGYLSKENDFWDYNIEESKAVNSVCEAVAQDVEEVGMPWIESLVDLQHLAAAIDKHQGKDQRAIILPPLLWMLDDLESALRVIETHIEYRKQHKGYLEYYLKYAERFRARTMEGREG